MDVTSTYRMAKISALKARHVAREIQGLPVSDALDLLQFTQRKGARLFAKTMRAALADAENNFELPIEGLVVKEATVGEGPTFKRWKARARGSAAPIRKRTSHLRVVLTDEVTEPEARPEKKSKPKSQKKAAEPKTAAKAKEPSGQSEKSSKSDGKAAGTKPAAAAYEENDLPEGARLDEAKGLVYDSAPPNADDLTKIGGVGPKLEEKLNSIGVYTYEQIANWSGSQVAEFDELLSFKGRIERDDWIAQAKDLQKG